MNSTIEQERKEKLLWQARYNTLKNAVITATKTAEDDCLDESIPMFQGLQSVIHRLDQETELPEIMLSREGGDFIE